MDAEDGSRAAAEGADGIFVSNHGGRQFDSQPATIDVRPSIVNAVAGRPFAYALATGGEGALEKAFSTFRDEFKGAMGSVGKTSVANLDQTLFVDLRTMPSWEEDLLQTCPWIGGGWTTWTWPPHCRLDIQ